MRPLKPYALALSGFIAAVFSAVFLGGHTAVRLPVSATTPQPELQANRLTSATDLSADREGKPAGKTPVPLPTFPSAVVFGHRSVVAGCPRELTLQPNPTALDRLIDWRERLHVGVVELRI